MVFPGLLWFSIVPVRSDENDPLGEAVNQSNESTAAVTALIQQLGSDEFGERRTAFMELWRLGSEALPQVKAAKSSDDLQLAQSAAALEPLLLTGTSKQEAGADVYDLLFSPSIDGVHQLCERGLWDLGQRVLETNPLLVTQIAGAGRSYLVTRFVQSALNQGDARAAWPIVYLILKQSPGGNETAAWVAAQIDLEFPEDASDDQKALRAFYKGQATDDLFQRLSPETRRKILTRSGQYQTLADPENIALLLGKRQGLAYEAARAVLSEFAGDVAQADRIWQQLLQTGDIERSGDGTGQAEEFQDLETARAIQLLADAPGFDSNQILYALLLSGRVDPITSFFKTKDPEACAEFLAAGADYSAVFELAGLKNDLSNFDDWLRRQTPSIEQEARQAISSGATFQKLSRICSILVGLGYADESEELLKKLVVNADTKTNLWQGAILRWMNQSEQRALLMRVLEPQLSTLPKEVQSLILARLFPEIQMTTAQLIATAPRMVGSDGAPLSRLLLLDKLNAWDQQFFEAQNTSISGWILKTRSRIMRRQPGQYSNITPQLEELAQIAKGCGLQDLALELARTDLQALGFMAPSVQRHRYVESDILLERGQATEAAELLRSMRKRSISPVPELLLKEEKASLLAGQHEEALRINESRWLAPLVNSRRVRGLSYAEVASDLIDTNDFSAATEYAKASFQLAPFGGVDIYWTASDLATIYEEDDRFDLSSEALRSSLVEALEPNSELVSWQIDNGNFHFLRYAAQRGRLHRAVADIMEGDFESADRNIAIGEKLQPQDIEMVVQCFPRLRDAGQAERARQLFDSFESTMLRQIENWPNDTTALNNLAWMYAKCDQKLDEAYRLAQKAVSLAPNSHIYLDTLAEVHFRASRYEAAIAAMEDCIRMAPREQHYRHNLERFLAARG